MEFMRAISIVFIVIHVYWFCYSAFVDMGINIGVVDRILLNFQKTARDESVRLHISGTFVSGYERCQEPEDDVAENIRRLPRRHCLVLHELVDA